MTLQEKYNLVLEGKYPKAQFSKEALYQFPQYLTNSNSYNDIVTILKNKSVINETIQVNEIMPTQTVKTLTMRDAAALERTIELLKKSLGMDNAYDNNADSEEPCDSEEDAELALIKQRAGVPIIAVQEMADDEPLEG